MFPENYDSGVYFALHAPFHSRTTTRLQNPEAYRVLLQTGRVTLERALAERCQFGVLPDYPLDQFTQREQNTIPVVIVRLQAIAVRVDNRRETRHAELIYVGAFNAVRGRSYGAAALYCPTAIHDDRPTVMLLVDGRW